MISSAVYTWLAAMIILILIEAVVPGLVSIWFALGSFAALIAALLKGPIWLQAVLFIFVSVIALIFTRPLAKKYVNSKVQRTNADAVIGKECVITQSIDNVMGTGSAKVGGKDWTARSYSDSVKIEQGSRAIVKSIEGVKLIVEPISE